MCLFLQRHTREISNIFPQVARDNEVIDARIFYNPTSGTSGVVVLTGNYKFYVVSNVKNPQSKKMADVPGRFPGES